MTVSSATTDIGTGTYTVMTQIAAEASGVSLEDITFVLGDSSLPTAPLQGGSFTVSSVGTAVQQACEALKEKLLAVARQACPAFSGATLEQVTFVDGQLRLGEASVALAELAQKSGETPLQAQVTAEPDANARPTRPPLGGVRRSAGGRRPGDGEGQSRGQRHRRWPGREPENRRSQILGGVVWGVGMALHEETLTDHALGRHMNHNLAEYHLPVNADIGDIEVIFVQEQDEIVNALGSKGVGEIGIVGVAAAVANAIYHATGKRVRDFPITLDKLI